MRGVVEWFCHGVSHGLCGFTFDIVYQGETGSALNQTDNGLLVVFADDGIGFPVTNPAACFDYGWTLLNELPIRYDAAMVILSVALFMLFLATQLLPW